MASIENRIVMEEVTDPEELAKARAQRERADRNAAWLQANASEVYSRNRGKHICVAGEELFVADTVEDVLARAKAAHPDDDGRFVLIDIETGEYEVDEDEMAASDRLLARVPDAQVWIQGQLPLTCCSGKDFQQERFAPTAAAPFHGDTVLAGMLFEQRQREAIEPGKVLPYVRIPNA